MNILIASKIHPHFIEKMLQAGHKCVENIMKDSSELEQEISKYEGIVINSRFVIGKELIDKAIQLKFLARIGAGMESIDTEYLEKKGIRWFNSPEGNRQAVGEHTLGMLLNLLNKINIADRQERQGQWIREANRGTEISEKIVAIIGYGNMGSAFARCLHGFDANVIAYDKYKKDYSDDFVCEKTLEEVFEYADIVSMHVPLTDETHNMVNDAYINSFKKNIYLINTSRGKVLNTEDLVKNMKSGKVTGAALDVLEYESSSFEKIGLKNFPEPMQYLVNADNVILTPHIAGWSVESNLKHAQVLVEKILNCY
ncbi:MAG: NAD(P)-dependent oxidoreductase [Bacteroidales bacterium]|jgi:D-3-phosphoglycerate dehydrogenase|nr:NAD(P)-binding domain-containing protein [Bacteroidales bacterium]MDD4214229.1 NAD(P)-dependent oxidoreductase [Bacteroidales bacterium]